MLQWMCNPSSTIPSSSNGVILNASPLGMDFGEFLLEGDITFLNQLAGVGMAQGMNKGVGVGNGNMGTDSGNGGVQ